MKFKYLLTASAWACRRPPRMRNRPVRSTSRKRDRRHRLGDHARRRGRDRARYLEAKQVLTQEQLARNNPGQTVLDSINIIPGVSFTNNDAYGSAAASCSSAASRRTASA
jgi:hypothetical protein